MVAGTRGGGQALDVAQVVAERGQRAGGFRGVDGERVGHAGGAEAVEAERAVAWGMPWNRWRTCSNISRKRRAGKRMWPSAGLSQGSSRDSGSCAGSG